MTFFVLCILHFRLLKYFTHVIFFLQTKITIFLTDKILHMVQAYKKISVFSTILTYFVHNNNNTASI